MNQILSYLLRGKGFSDQPIILNNYLLIIFINCGEQIDLKLKANLHYMS